MERLSPQLSPHRPEAYEYGLLSHPTIPVALNGYEIPDGSQSSRLCGWR